MDDEAEVHHEDINITDYLAKSKYVEFQDNEEDEMNSNNDPIHIPPSVLWIFSSKSVIQKRQIFTCEGTSLGNKLALSCIPSISNLDYFQTQSPPMENNRYYNFTLGILWNYFYCINVTLT